MTATSGRTSEYKPDRIAWSHQRAAASGDGWPRAGRWYLITPKTDGMMQSAGGLMTSPNDMALWLEAQLRGEGPAGSGLTPAIFTRARTDRVAQPADGHGFSCDGYVYGWGVCNLIIDAKADAAEQDHVLGPVFQHGGGYTGVRSLMTAAPRFGLGVAFLSNSDSMTGYLAQEVTKLVFELSQDVPGAEARRTRRIAEYRERNARYVTDLNAGLQDRKADAKWRGWAWAPSAAEHAALAGDYRRAGALLPEAAVQLIDGVLVMTSSDRRYRLRPAAPDLFGAQTFAYDEIAAIAFVREPGGKVVALDWNGQRYGKR
jgi:hypothetical protein